MPRPASCRFAAVLVLAAVLLVPALGAAAPRPGHPVPGGLAAPMPDLVSQLWGFLTRLWSANGLELDPSGRPETDSAASSAACDNGWELDPNGRCGTESATSSAACDNGWEIDPSGRCVG